MSCSPVRSLLILSALVGSALAQPVPASDSAVPAPGVAERQTQVEQSTPPPAPSAPPLTLPECIAFAMKKNFDLQVQGYVVQQARDSLIIAKSNFDPTFNAAANRSVSQAASAVSRIDGVTFDGLRTDDTTFQIGASQRVPQTNGLFSLSATALRGTSNSSNELFNPQYGNGVTAALSQPLLKDAGATIAQAQVKRGQLGVTIATLNYRSRVLVVIRDTENAYYNLVAARETLRIRQLSLELAQRLLEENQARRATGVATDLDVATAQVGVANARRAEMQSDQAVRDAEDALLSLINAPNLDNRPGPVSFQDYAGPAPSFAVSYKLARDYYPDTLSAADTIKQLEIDLAVAKKNQLPSLNLNATVGYTSRPTDQGYWQTFDTLAKEHGNNWSVGLSYTWPWGRRADKANYRLTQAGLRSQQARLDQLEVQLLVNVRGAVRAVETNLASVQIAAEATQLAAKQYDLQKARFDAGLSTSRLVLQAQDDLETARVNELSAKATLWSAMAELHRLEGSSIERFHVEMPE